MKPIDSEQSGLVLIRNFGDIIITTETTIRAIAKQNNTGPTDVYETIIKSEK